MAPTDDLTEVADRVWVARHAWYDVNVTVVVGARGALVVDTLASERAAAALRDRVRPLLPPGTPVLAVVSTHEHHDHVLGNATFRDAWPDVALVGHEEAAERMATVLPGWVASAVREGYPRADEIAASRVVPPTTTLSSVHVVDLGDRLVEVVHPGRGHTGGDVVVRVPDADVLVAGDLVEAADDPDAAVPAYGDDSWPLEWPGALELLLGLSGGATVVVPGHGPVVDRAFVAEQQRGTAAVAARITELAAAGTGPAEALGAGGWPYAAGALAAAVRRGYAHLPPGARRLPLA